MSDAFLSLNGASGSATTPNSVALQVANDLEVIVKARLASGAIQTIVSHGLSDDPGEYSLDIDASGHPRLSFNEDIGIPSPHYIVATDVVATDADTWIKVTRTDNGDSTWTIAFFSGSDGETWVAVGDEIVEGYYISGTVTTTISPHSLTIGATAAGDRVVNGRIYYLNVKNATTSTNVLTVDFRNEANGEASFAATTGQTITINSPAQILGNSEAAATFDATIPVVDGGGGPIEGAIVRVRAIAGATAAEAVSNVEREFTTDAEGNAVVSIIDGVTYAIQAGYGRSQYFTADSTSSTASIPAIIYA